MSARQLYEVSELTPQHRRFDREDLYILGRVARQRADFCAARRIVVPDDVRPTEAAAILRLRTARLLILGSLQHDLDSYPVYLYVQLAKHFPRVERAHFDRTVDKLVECCQR